MKEAVIIDYTIDHVALDELIHRVQSHFMSWLTKAQQQKVLFGFDGFLDELYMVVRKQSTIDSYELMTSMSEWATQIQKTAGSGTNCETILKDRRTGGFVANTSEALVACGEMGPNLTMMGCFGSPTMLPLFQEKFQKKYNCSLYSFGNPGTTNAYEFDDGKVMMTNFTPVHSIDIPLILNCIPKEKFHDLIQHAALFGLGYWSMLLQK